MLTYEYWNLDGNKVISNYHYCPDYDLDIFFDVLPRKWSFVSFTLPSDSSSSTEEESQSETSSDGSSSSEEEQVFLPPTSSTDALEMILLNLFDF